MKIVAAMRDLSERVRAEEALRINEERLALAARAGKVGVWDWNLLTGALYLAENFKAMLGYEDDEIPGDFDIWLQHVYEEDREKHKQPGETHIMLQSKENQSVPQVTFRTRENNQWKDVTSNDIFAGNTIVLFALPGAFTPTCSSSHLPRYDQLAPVLKENGVSLK